MAFRNDVKGESQSHESISRQLYFYKVHTQAKWVHGVRSQDGGIFEGWVPTAEATRGMWRLVGSGNALSPVWGAGFKTKFTV